MVGNEETFDNIGTVDSGFVLLSAYVGTSEGITANSSAVRDEMEGLTDDDFATNDASERVDPSVIGDEVASEPVCHESYGGCVPVDDPVTCDDLDETDIDVTGDDEFGLDTDGDGVARESYGPIDQDGDGCHDSYVGGCVPVDRDDYECPELYDLGLIDLDVVGPDSFHLDADEDGTGCEAFVEEPAEEGEF